MTRSRQPVVETLEDRTVPATWGNPWPDAMHLTVSFAPDGTPIAGLTSNLFQSLNARMPTAAWETVILRALQTWAVNANINLGVVADQGQAFGGAGLPQSDPRFGDIRIGGLSLSKDVMAFTNPFDFTGSTWSGDIRLNTAYQFGQGGQSGI